MMFIKDNFSNEEKYKLYRTMYEIIHPSISKKNISSYKIVLDDNYLPVRVFYPLKVSSIDSVIIFVPGNGLVTNCYGKYEDICKDMAVRLNKLIICIDYFDCGEKYPYLFDKVYESIDFLLDQVSDNGINPKKVCLMGESFGGCLVSGVTLKRCDDNLNNKYKEILLYPLVSGEYFGNSKFDSLKRDREIDKELLDDISKSFKRYISNKKRLSDKYICPLKGKDFSLYPDTFIITGESDIVKDEGYAFYNKLHSFNENSKYLNVEFLEHGFIDFTDDNIKEEIYNKIDEFL